MITPKIIIIPKYYQKKISIYFPIKNFFDSGFFYQDPSEDQTLYLAI